MTMQRRKKRATSRNVLNLSLTASDRETLEKVATAAGTTISEWIRTRLHAAAQGLPAAAPEDRTVLQVRVSQEERAAAERVAAATGGLSRWLSDEIRRG